MPPRYVLTCAHVVASALGRRLEDDPHATVRISLSGGLQLEGSPGGGHQYTGGSHHEDFSVLTLHGDLHPANGQLPTSHAHLSSGTYSSRRPMQVYGYPQGQPDGVWADCVMAGEGGREKALIQLNDAPDTGRKVDRGYSGCGVKDASTSRVAGLAVLRDKAPEAGVTWMIPMARLARSWPPLRAALALSGERYGLTGEPDPSDYTGPFDPEAMDDLYRLLLDGRISLPGLVALRDEALGPVRRTWKGAPEDILGMVHDLQHISQAGRSVPPLLTFVAALSLRVPGPRGAELARWVRGRAGHCTPAVDPGPLLERRPARPAGTEARWTYATFCITPAAPRGQYLLDVFRQHEGAPREAVQQYTEALRLNRIENLMVEHIVRMRRERAMDSPELFVEVVLPRELLGRRFDGLLITTPSGAKVRLGVVHPVALRSLERQNASEWVDWGHNWSHKWDRMKALPALSGEGVVDVIPARSQDTTPYEGLFVTFFAEDGPLALVLGFPPRVPRKRAPDAEFDAALDAGVPALVWAHDERDGRRIAEELPRRLRGASARTLPEAVRGARRGERSPGPGTTPHRVSGGLLLGFLWDPFDRLPPRTPLAPPAPAPGGDPS